MNLRYLSSVVILGLLLAGLILPAGTALAQISVGRIVQIQTAKIYPGEPVVVTIEIYTSTTYTVQLCADASCAQPWASVTKYASVAGTYDVILTLPTKLPGAADSSGDKLIDLRVSLWVWGNEADYKATSVYPKVVVTPPSSTIVDAFGNPQTVKVEFLGYVPGDTVGSVKFDGPITGTYTITPVTIGPDGYGTTTIDLLALTGKGLPRGTYKVTGISGGSTDTTNVKPGSLEIRPQVTLSPNAGNGRCDSTTCELTGMTLTGYGFDANVRILKVDLLNINFTNVRYTFTPPSTFKTDGLGYFTLSNLKQYIAGGKGTNMTAGLYIPIVYEAPLPTTLTNSSSIALKTQGTVQITESAVVPVLGTRASIKATSYVDAKLDYVLKQSRMSYALTEVLKVNISYGGKLYQLAANLEGGNVRFALYNITTVPYVTMFSGLATPTPDPSTGANVAHVSFNITPTSYVLTAPTSPGQFRFWATFYSYPNQILLLLKEWSLVISKANATVTYTNKDTGTTVSKYYEYPTNMSTADYKIVIPTLTFTDANIQWSIDWTYDMSDNKAYIKVTAQPTVGPSFEFRNVYYIVRPLLVLLTSGVIMPGSTVTIAAYGYGPSSAWGYPGYNTLYVYWEKIVKLGEFTLGKDGNLTFKITVPSDASFGVHYIWGVDKWTYEYTLAIIVGAKAYWYTGKTTPEVLAGLDGKRIVICPCPESAGVKGLKYCAQCATYTGTCDYLGDIIKVVIAGLSPGETVRVYFGGTLMLTVKANKSTEEVSFVVPTVPAGTYTITVVGSASGSITVDQFFNTTKLITASPTVVPKVLLLDLNKDVVPIIVGSGFVRVIGTGFPVGASMYAVLFNGTDAAYTLNAHVTRWIVDPSGKLTSPFTKVLGIYVPVVEPGAYAVSLVYALPDGTTKETVAGYVYVINNISIMTTKDDLSKATQTLSSKMDSVSAAISSAVGALSSKIDGVSAAIAALSSKVDSAVGTLSSKIDAVGTKVDSLSGKVDSAVADLKSKIDASTADIKAAMDSVFKSLSSAVTTITSKVDAVSGKVDTVSSKIDTLRSSVDAVSGTLKTVADKLSTIDTAVAGVKSDVAGLKTDVSTIKSDVSAVKSGVDSVKTDISGVKSDVAGLKTDVSTIKSDVSAVKSDVSGIPGKIDGATIATYIAVIFALLAFIMATLGFVTIRKVTGAPKSA
jgi:peptidoglycan hydrolase CwlO-like protein